MHIFCVFSFVIQLGFKFQIHLCRNEFEVLACQLRKAHAVSKYHRQQNLTEFLGYICAHVSNFPKHLQPVQFFATE